MGSFGKNIALWIIIGLLLVALFQLFQGGSSSTQSHELAFSEFMADVEDGQVSDVTIQGQNLTGHYLDGREFNTYTPNDPSLVGTLRAYKVQITAAPVESGVPFFNILLSWFPMFAGERPAVERPIYVVGVKPKGRTVKVDVSFWSVGGYNQGKHTLRTIVREGRSEEFCHQLAGRIVRRGRERGSAPRGRSLPTRRSPQGCAPSGRSVREGRRRTPPRGDRRVRLRRKASKAY